MITVIVVGDSEFYRDADKTNARMGHYILSAIDDMTGTIAKEARSNAPGSLKAAVGNLPGLFTTGGFYRGTVGVRKIPRHAKFVHEGTGIYGPKKKPYTITKVQTNFGPNWGVDRTGRLNPAVGNVFRIPEAGGEGAFYRRKVTILGQKAQPFLTEAFELAKHTEIPMRIYRLARDIVH